MSGAQQPVVVIGAGPHGLSAATHLRAAGVETLVFGEPLEFWRNHMPAGMVLRSRKRSTHIAHPSRAFTIDRYAESERRPVHEPLRIEEFIDYAMWFHRHAVPDVDRRKVAAISRDNGGFRVTLRDGDEVAAPRVVVAAGLVPFARRPQPFTPLPRSYASHSFDHTDLSTFASKRVLVVGGGQSALESAALLNEAGAAVELLIRAAQVQWLWEDDSVVPFYVPEPKRRSVPTDVGAGLGGWIAAAPDLWRLLPAARRERLAYNCIRPAGSGWLRPRLRGVTLSVERRAVKARISGEQVDVVLDDGSKRFVDHVLLGTGYAIDVARYPFIPAELSSQLALANGYPLLGPGLESSVPGLHFVGAPAATSFGPVMRFVVGTHYSATAVAQRATGRRQSPIRFSF